MPRSFACSSCGAPLDWSPHAMLYADEGTLLILDSVEIIEIVPQ